MSELSGSLQHARARQWRMALAVGGVLLLMGIVLGVFFLGLRSALVEISPADAAQQAEVRVVRGIGVVVGDKVYGLGKALTVGVSAPGFVAEEVALPQGMRFVNVTLQPLPSGVALTTRPVRSDIRWYVDGQLVVVAPTLKHDLAAGTYIVTAAHAYHRATTLEVEVQRGARVEGRVDLQPLDGRLLVTDMTPDDAALQINGRPQAPAAEYPLAGGKHTVTLAHHGYQELTDTFTITNTQSEVRRSYRLVPQDARITFSLSPPHGRLLLDGRTVNAAAPLAVRPGVAHRATYSRAGYTAATMEFTATSGEAREIEISLQAESGTVEIHATPAATVLIDGRRAGETPMTATLPTVEHEVTLMQSGYRTVVRKVTPAAAAPRRIDVQLLTERAARIAEQPARYKNGAGITMQRFISQDSHPRFTMGAPPWERGRRANELEREVILTKAFYVGVHEVTRAQYAASRSTRPSGDGDLPITDISWAEAARFCNWLSMQEGLMPFYRFTTAEVAATRPDADGYRLPTEAEWEWLARYAGRRAPVNLPWGEGGTVPPRTGNFADESAKGQVAVYIPGYDDGFAAAAAVGRFPRDAAGLYDLAGNVREWVHDAYNPNPPVGVATDPTGSAAGYPLGHVVKGAGWRSGMLSELHASFREGVQGGHDDVGFRVARYVFGKAHAAP